MPDSPRFPVRRLKNPCAVVLPRSWVWEAGKRCESQHWRMGWVAFLEGIAIPEPELTLNARFLGDLISLVTLLVSHLEGDAEKPLWQRTAIS